MAKKQQKKGKSILAKIIIAMLMLAIIVLYKAAFMLVLFGMLPSIVAYYADNSTEKNRISTIFCCNLAGLLPYFIPFAQNGGAWEELNYRLSDYNMWIVVYGMAACGYGLIKLCPAIYHGFLRVSYASKAFQMQQKQDALLKEWGDDVAMLAASSVK